MLNANKNIDRLERDLRQAILTGVLAPSTRLVAVRSLADQYGLTYGRTLRALKRLEKQGLLSTRHGGGTYVADKTANASVAQRRTENGGAECAIIVAPQNYWTGDEGLWFVEFIRGFETHVGAGGSGMKIVSKEDYIGPDATHLPDAWTHVILSSLNEGQLKAARERAHAQTTFVLGAFDPLHADWALVMDIDGPAGIGLGMDALRERGHSNIAMLSWTMPDHQAWWPDRREKAYDKAMREAKRKGFIVQVPFPGLENPGPEARKIIEAQILKVLKKRPRPTALICVNDLLARFTLDVCARQGIAVPKDLSIVGFDDEPWAVTRGLSTMRRPYRELGQMVGELALQNQRQTRSRWRGSLMIEPQLILRSSVDFLRD